MIEADRKNPVVFEPEVLGSVLLVWALDLVEDPRDAAPEAGEDAGVPALFRWTPHNIRLELADRGYVLPEASFDRLMAAITIVTTDLFFRDARGFARLAAVLCGGRFDPETFDPPDAAECAWAVTEALLLVPVDDEDPEPFSTEVRRYLGATLAEEGYLEPVDVLRVALPAAPRTADPEVRAAQAEKNQGVLDALRAQFDRLVDQLDRLELIHGDAKGAAAGLRSRAAARRGR